MTDESAPEETAAVPESARRAFDRHAAFEPRPTPGTNDCTTTPFEVVTTASPETAQGRDARFRLSITLPVLSTVTEEDVGPTVAEGWFESLERHLTDAAAVAGVDPTTGPTIERTDDRIHLTVEFPAWEASAGVGDVKTIVDYVEGTYVQAVIPGYTYQEPVTELLAHAREQGGDDPDDETRRGGTPL